MPLGITEGVKRDLLCAATAATQRLPRAPLTDALLVKVDDSMFAELNRKKSMQPFSGGGTRRRRRRIFIY